MPLREAYPSPSSPAASAVMRGNRRRDTRPEMALRRALHRLGARYRVDLRIEAGDVVVRPDVVFTRRRLAIFVDGCFWHACAQHGTKPSVNLAYWQAKLARNVARDQRVTEALTTSGWRVIRVWEHEDPEDAACVIAGAAGLGCMRNGPQHALSSPGPPSSRYST